jgi:hypothetical protein
VFAGLTVANLAVGTTMRTINRLEVGGAIYVATKKRHGHVELTLWNRIIDALTQHGVELLPEGDRHGLRRSLAQSARCACYQTRLKSCSSSTLEDEEEK